METRKANVTYVMVAGALCLAAWAASAMPRKPIQTLPTVDPVIVNTPLIVPTVSIPKAPPRVEIVFAVDTTGSMSGLLDGAKRKIWQIASMTASAQPKPDLRIGLVAYRDIGDEYVTRFYDLSDDIDQVFERLQSFEAAGGGDTPEHVARALHDAVERTSWSDGQNAVKIVYLVGDAPPHFDYSDGFDINRISRRAHDMNVHINTIRCGSDSETAMVWKRISGQAAGEYASIDQSGGVKTIATPYDDKMAALNAKLAGTALGYGVHAGEVRAKATAAAAMPASSAADRASFFGLKGGAVGGDGDLVKDIADGKVNIAAVPAAALPPEMKSLDEGGRRAYVAHRQAEREEAQKEINALAAQRNDYLKKAPKKADAFDTKVEDTIKSQAGAAGLTF